MYSMEKQKYITFGQNNKTCIIRFYNKTVNISTYLVNIVFSSSLSGIWGTSGLFQKYTILTSFSGFIFIKLHRWQNKLIFPCILSTFAFVIMQLIKKSHQF